MLDTVNSEKSDAASTTDDVLEGIDLAGKRVLVTGVSAGLGVETARALAAHHAEVVGAARDLGKAKAATDTALGRSGGLRLAELDLASLASVRACTDRLLADGRPFDLVICNAGVMATPFGKTADGFERQFGTNHLGHFVLVNRIAPLMRPGARLVNLSSAGHQMSDVDLDDPNFERQPYDPWVGYGRSKTANILFAVAFDHRHAARGVRAAAVHPGGIQTELSRYLDEDARRRLDDILAGLASKPGAQKLTYKSVPQGAATSVWAGVRSKAEDVGGRYCEDCHVAKVVDVEGFTFSGVRPYALDAARAEALWAKSEEMVGERF